MQGESNCSLGKRKPTADLGDLAWRWKGAILGDQMARRKCVLTPDDLVEIGAGMSDSYFARVRRSGFDIGLSAGKLTKAMTEVLLQLPPEAKPTKDGVVQYLGLLGQMSKTRDINSAWTRAKRQIAREHPDKFFLSGKVLRRVSDGVDRAREKLSAAGHRKLATLAAKEGASPDEMLSGLISAWRKGRKPSAKPKSKSK